MLNHQGLILLELNCNLRSDCLLPFLKGYVTFRGYIFIVVPRMPMVHNSKNIQILQILHICLINESYTHSQMLLSCFLNFSFGYEAI